MPYNSVFVTVIAKVIYKGFTRINLVFKSIWKWDGRSNSLYMHLTSNYCQCSSPQNAPKKY